MNKYLQKTAFFIIFCISTAINGQKASVSGTITTTEGEPLGFANISIVGSIIGTMSNDEGIYSLEVDPGQYKLSISFLGYQTLTKRINIQKDENRLLDFTLMEDALTMDEIVVTGTMKEVNRLESPVPVEVYNPAFFKKNPTPNVYEALQNVNGVRPQLNCQVCNTGDIHI
ncbi:MAG: carboxypeptidase-like regulatory domain-containing protein, partial [Saprospiraceae bacterium]|nr:carboxypeptidase-like regulatory domain-containing protein [Bacteroidia bacterium]NNL92429.1 carboxypeptidase-like regulatory domain-containing protein [Saprospiraceae bacterium]